MYYSVMFSKRLMDVCNREGGSINTFVDTFKNVQTMTELATLYSVKPDIALGNTDYINIYDIVWFLCNKNSEKTSRQERTERANCIVKFIKNNNYILNDIMKKLISEQGGIIERECLAN